MSDDKPYRWHEEYGISEDEYFSELCGYCTDWLEETKIRCKRAAIPVEQYLRRMLREDRETSRLCGRRPLEPIPLMGFQYTGKTLFINFYKMWPHVRKPLLERAELPPYPWRTPAAVAAGVAQDEKAARDQANKPTPKTDTSLIYQADAAEFYNIPKSVLSKAAHKRPGQPGYLWSGTEGRRRFYRKADLERMSRSRERLRGS